MLRPADDSARGGAVLAVALAGGVLDLSVAASREPVGGAASAIAMVGAAALSVAAVGVLHTAWTTASRGLAPAGRRVALAVVGTALGLVVGEALFSGTGVRRHGLHGPLVVAATLAGFAAGVFGARRARRDPPELLQALAGCALYAAHAAVLVRQYALLHGLLAAGAAWLWCSAANGTLRGRFGRGFRAAAIVLLAASGLALGRSHALRGVVRRAAPLGGYAARAAGLVRRDEWRVDEGSIARPRDGASLPLTDGDVVLVTVDALRADALRALGGSGRMPFLDAFAARGWVFHHAYAATPHTSYSLASLMTGTHARAAMALGSTFPRGATLAGRLGDAGFVTAGWYPPAVFAVDGDRFATLAARRWDLGHAEMDWSAAADRVGRAIRWSHTIPRDRRAFAWVHLFEPHEPYALHAEHDYGSSARQRYDAECSAVDDALRTLIEGWGRPATWVVTADHGEEFGEHGGAFHGTSLYDEQARVPLVLVSPAVAPQQIRAAVSLVDLLPTLLRGVGAGVPEGVEGSDLGVLQRNTNAPLSAYAETGSLRMVARSGEKLVADTSDGTLERYALDADPAERHNLADDDAAGLHALRVLLAQWEAGHARAAAERTHRAAPEVPPALARGLQGDRSAASEVAELLDAGGDIGVSAARVLGDLGDDRSTVRDALADALRGPPELGRAAALSLVLLGDARGRAGAETVLSSPGDVAAQRRAALGLARWSVRGTAPVLEGWAVDDRAPDAERDRVLAALRTLRAPSSRAVWEALLHSPRLNPTAADALADLRDRAALPALVEAQARWRYPRSLRQIARARATLGDPRGGDALREAIGVGDPVVDVSALLAPFGEPGHAVQGWRGPARVLRTGVPSSFRGDFGAVARVYVAVDATGEGSLSLDGFEPAALRPGPQEVVLTRDAARPLRTLTLRATVPVRVSMVAAAPSVTGRAP